MKEFVYQYKSGIIQFYLRGELYAYKVCQHTTDRLAFMIKQNKETANLKGERYFLWIPNTKITEVQ